MERLDGRDNSGFDSVLACDNAFGDAGPKCDADRDSKSFVNENDLHSLAPPVSFHSYSIVFVELGLGNHQVRVGQNQRRTGVDDDLGLDPGNDDHAVGDVKCRDLFCFDRTLGSTVSWKFVGLRTGLPANQPGTFPFLFANHIRVVDTEFDRNQLVCLRDLAIGLVFVGAEFHPGL